MRAVLIVCLAPVWLVACDDGGSARMRARLAAMQARRDPPQLWSVAVVGEAAGGRPVHICADTSVRSGFRDVIPASGPRHCARLDGWKGPPPGPGHLCELNGQTHRVISDSSGDPARDFRTRSTIRRVADGQVLYARTLRFQYEGACPNGWRVGDATDQAGHIAHAR